ncbi:ClpP/crotonase [Fomitiporia mediterranea MF3/22]|uniref:ClpP/crotonase n=1 Tax=Fomitiporia mediterranea (strain MF3/22) TaxID=694068 RepID=UPI00044095E0|nr:ClpP/crotonase [Fomitiporia mediterranea MF3/22]EJD06973.1 ClpP/crotonase [Fomitiporia mediterranea MF3/22]
MTSYKLPADRPILTVSRDAQNSCIWIIEMHNGEDNRLTHDLINGALKPALDMVEREWRDVWRAAQATNKPGSTGSATQGSADGRGALIIIGKRDQNKFFSNGLDFANATKDPNFFPDTYNTLVSRLLAFPIPIIAAINGHCFAAGLVLALACDYRVMTDGKERRAWCCMNEVHFGAPWPLSLATVARAKVSNARTLRKLALEGHRFTPQEALKEGIIDVVADGSSTEAVLAAAKALALERAENAKTGVWGLIKKEIYRQTLKEVSKDYRQIQAVHADLAARARL